MIYVHRDLSGIPINIRNDLLAAARGLASICCEEHRKEFIEKHAGTWSAARPYLRAMSYEKCWYSEAKESVSRYHVDHFRPHGRAKQALADFSPGYSWLAFDIDNFRIAGVLCNTANKEHSAETVGKSDWFPLSDPSMRACFWGGSFAGEQPILLDPVDPDDPAKLLFLDDGNVVPEKTLDLATKSAVEVAIKCLGLRQKQLKDGRSKCWLRCYRKIKKFKRLEKIPKGRRSSDDSETLKELREELIGMGKSSSEFAAVARCCLIANGLGRLVVADELLPLAIEEH